MLSRLRHWAGSCGDNQDCAIHLGSAGNHVLDIVSMSGAVYVGIMTMRGFILHMGCIDCDTTGFFFRGFVDILSLIHISEPTRLGMISYAVFCLKQKKKKKEKETRHV